MTTIEILKKARELLSDAEHWAQGDYAYLYDDCGALTPVDWKSPSAECWCPAGALLKVSCDQATDALTELARGLPGIKAAPFTEDEYNKAIDQIAIWNDTPERTHAEVLQRFDEAIARLGAASHSFPKKPIPAGGSVTRAG